MNPKCHRCTKSVYPVEKLNCLDKIWHKGCFNCETCKMTLSMKTYKGYGKLPYCNTHCPTGKATTVAETPESLRLKKNTQNQSGVTYTKDFVKEKGKVIAVADSVAAQTAQKAQNNASQLAYQGVTVGIRRESESVQPRLPSSSAPPPSQQQQEYQQQYQPPPPAQEYEPPAPAPAPAPASGPKYVAIYDYTAADDDEVSFIEGDIITDGEIIDDGWMTGKVQRTGQTGMLPSNYVEPEQPQ